MASLERGYVISIIYQKGDAITKRNIQVLKMENGNIHAFCYLRNQRRVFKKSSILAASYLNKKDLMAIRTSA